MPHIGELSQQQIDAMAALIEYATRYDQDSSTPTLAYFGKAAISSAEGSAVWQIKKMTYGTDGDINTYWCDGNAAFDNIWTNRASLTYT